MDEALKMSELEDWHSFMAKAKDDELVKAMKENAVSEQFVNERLKELYEEAISKEKEQVREGKAAEIKEMESEKEYSRRMLDEANYNFKQIIQAEQRASTETFQQITQKFKGKAKQFKNKIRKQKQTILERDEQLQSYRKTAQDLKRANEELQNTMKEDLKKVRDIWEQKCKDVELESKRKEAEDASRYQLNILAMQESYQNAMEHKIVELKAELIDKAKNESISKTEFDQLKGDYHKCTSENTSLKNDIESVKGQKEELEKEVYKLRGKLSDSENKQSSKEFSVFKIMMDEANIKLGKLEVVAEEAERKKREAELDANKAKDEIESYKRNILELRNEIKKLTEFKHTHLNLREQLDESNLAYKTLESEHKHLQAKSQSLEKHNFNLENQLQDIQSNLVTEKCNQFEEEKILHVHTRNKLLQAEGSCEQLSEDLKKYEKKIGELKGQLKDYEIKNDDLNQKLFEYDKALTLSNNERRNLESKLKNNRSSNSDCLSRNKYKLRSRTKELKNDFSQLKTGVETDIKILQEFSKHINDHILRELSNFKRQSEHSSSIIVYKQEIENLNQRIKNLKTKQGEFCKNYEGLKHENKNLKHEIGSMKIEKAMLEDKLRKNSSAFSRLQEDVSTLSQQKHTRYRSSLTENSDRIIDLQAHIQKLQSDHQVDILDMKRKYQTLLEKAYKDIEIENKKHLSLRQRFEEIEKYANDLQIEHESSIKDLENQVLYLLNIVKTKSDFKKYESSSFDVHRKDNLKKKFDQFIDRVDLQSRKHNQQVSANERDLEVFTRANKSQSKIQIAQELDRETQELTRQAQRPKKVYHKLY